MEYNATTQRGVLLFLLVITVLSAMRYFVSDLVVDVIFYLQIVTALTILVSLFIRFKLVIEDGNVSFQTLFLSLSVYKRVFSPEQINQIKFKRIGWSTKCAVIQVNKGVNVRIANFTPNNIFDDLNEFANEKGISTSKTKDYLILER